MRDPAVTEVLLVVTAVEVLIISKVLGVLPGNKPDTLEQARTIRTMDVNRIMI
jgi:hypothetical protein